MFEVGFTEVLLLGIIALLVLGPERLPGVARTLGGLTRKARSSWLNLKRSIDAEINAEEIRKPLQKMQSDVRSAVDGVDQQLKKAGEAVSSTLGGNMAGAAAAQATKPTPTDSDSDSDSEAPDTQTSSNEPQ